MNISYISWYFSWKICTVSVTGIKYFKTETTNNYWVIVAIVNRLYLQSVWLTKVYLKYKSRAEPEAISYRPISMAIYTFKYHKNIALKRLLDNWNLFTAKQHGFLKGCRSTTSWNKVTQPQASFLISAKHLTIWINLFTWNLNKTKKSSSLQDSLLKKTSGSRSPKEN